MDKEKEIDAFLTNIYYTVKQPSSFTGAKKLWKYAITKSNRPAGLSFKIVKKWLNHQDTHNIHKKPRRRFPRESIIVEHKNEMFDGDLLVITDLAEYNNGYKYIAVFIDLFSRYCWARPLKNKTAKETASALKAVFQETQPCTYFRSDLGKEFLGKPFQDLLKEYKVHHIKAYNEHHASYAERMNRTLQDKLYKYFYENQTYKYIDILQDLVKSYNNTVHGTTGFAPAKVNENNSLELYRRVYLPILDSRPSKHPKFTFNIGDYVRLSLQRRAFERGYKERFTEEIFVISARVPSHPPRYKLKDLRGEEILGSFYQHELQSAKGGDAVEFKIEKIVKHRTLRGRRQALVKWYGYSDDFNSYVDVKDLKDYKGKAKK